MEIRPRRYTFSHGALRCKNDEIEIVRHESIDMTTYLPTLYRAVAYSFREWDTLDSSRGLIDTIRAFPKSNIPTFPNTKGRIDWSELQDEPAG